MLAALVFSVTHAQDEADRKADTDNNATDSSAGKSSRFFDAEDGQFDVSSFLERPAGFLPIPMVITEPAVGYGGGLAGLFLRPRTEAGSEGWARPNFSAIGGFGTENGTKGLFGADSSRWFDGRLKTLVAGGTGKVNLDFYGLGATKESLDESVSYSLEFDGGLVQGNWRLGRKSPWSVGLRYIYAQVEPKLRDAPVFPNLADRIDVKVSAPAAILEFDSRDNIFTPTRGLYSESYLLVSRESLGATADFERFQQVLMWWFPMADHWTLGARADYQWTSDDTPFFMRPYIELRGVPAMRYQGEEMASTELEVRWQFHNRWSAIFAGGYGAAHTDTERFSSTKDIVSGAVGFRYELASKFGMHAGMDVGFSGDTIALYLQVGNAWFRP